MVLALALLLLVAVAVLAFGVHQAVRRQPHPPDREPPDPGKGKGLGRGIWAGLGLAVCGAIGYVLATGASGPYQGPMTGLPAALVMMASLGAIALGLLAALFCFVLKLLRGSSPGDLQDDSTLE